LILPAASLARHRAHPNEQLVVFAQTQELIPNHLLRRPAGRVAPAASIKDRDLQLRS